MKPPVKRPFHRAVYNAVANVVTVSFIVVVSVGGALWYWGSPREER